MASFGNMGPEGVHYALAFEDQLNDSVRCDISLPRDLHLLLSRDSLTREPVEFQPTISDDELDLFRQVEMRLVNTERGEI